jgi:hypothetical protein
MKQKELVLEEIYSCSSSDHNYIFRFKNNLTEKNFSVVESKYRLGNFMSLQVCFQGIQNFKVADATQRRNYLNLCEPFTFEEEISLTLTEILQKLNL